MTQESDLTQASDRTQASDDRSGEPLLEVTDLSVSFPARSGGSLGRGGEVRAVDGVDLVVRRGETVGLVGESGCGKSTLARAVLRLNQPTSGSIRFDGVQLRELRGARMRRMRRRIQMVFQDPHASLNPRKTVGAVLAEAIRTHRLAGSREIPEKVARLVELVGLPANAVDRYPHEFSGGQRQRIGIARALAVEPDLLIADEAVSALDVSIRAQVLNLLARLGREFGLAMLFIGHDLAVVRHISDRIVVMYLGSVVESAPAAQIYQQPLHPYTIALVSAVPIPDPAVEGERERLILTGDVPSPLDPPSGCRFHPRCWLRTELDNPERCATDRPQPREVVPGQQVTCHFAEQLADPDRRRELLSAAAARSAEWAGDAADGLPAGPAGDRAAAETGA